MFCLQDGTSLVAAGPPETQTLVLGEIETAVGQGLPDRVTIPIDDTRSYAWQESQVTHTASASDKKGSNTLLAVGLTVVGMLILFGVVAIAGILLLQNRQQAGPQNIQNIDVAKNINTLSGDSNVVPDRQTATLPRTLPSATPVRTPVIVAPTPVPKPPVVMPPDVPPTKLSSYPSTTRLRFARGAVSTSFSGDVNPGDGRSLVLACRPGQSLSARVSSPGGCVQIRGGGASLRTTTVGGDNYIGVTNNCSSVVRFSISITII